MKVFFEAKDLSNVASIRRGKQNEKVVRSYYARKMQKHLNKNFTAYDTGLVVNPFRPYLGAIPGSKVIDPRLVRPKRSFIITSKYSSSTDRTRSLEERASASSAELPSSPSSSSSSSSSSSLCTS